MPVVLMAFSGAYLAGPGDPTASRIGRRDVMENPFWVLPLLSMLADETNQGPRSSTEDTDENKKRY